jgi:16S rRNA pseudouridine516 synthase
MPAERLQKLIAAAGLGSRRRGEQLLREGRVQIDGRTARPGDQADPDRALVTVDGRPLRPAPPPLTLLLNKPVGVLCTCHDPQGRPTVLDLLPEELRSGRGLHPVGRLDADSRGALLLSNVGDLTLRLTHPRYGHRRTYRVWVEGRPDAATLQRWRDGVALDGRPSMPVRVRLLGSDPGGARQRSGSGRRPAATLLELEMGEGRNRQIRRTAQLLGHPVLDLQRRAIGSLRLGGLREGEWRTLSRKELGDQQWEQPADRR